MEVMRGPPGTCDYISIHSFGSRTINHPTLFMQCQSPSKFYADLQHKCFPIHKVKCLIFARFRIRDLQCTLG